MFACLDPWPPAAPAPMLVPDATIELVAVVEELAKIVECILEDEPALVLLELALEVADVDDAVPFDAVLLVKTLDIGVTGPVSSSAFWYGEPPSS